MTSHIFWSVSCTDLYVEAHCHKLTINLMASIPSLFPIPLGSWALCDSSPETVTQTYSFSAPSASSVISEVWTKSWFSQLHFGMQVLEPFLDLVLFPHNVGDFLIPLLCGNWPSQPPWWVKFLQTWSLLCACVLSHFNCVGLSVTLWTSTCRDPLSMGFLQARLLGWVAMLRSRGFSDPGMESMPHPSTSIGRWVFYP